MNLSGRDGLAEVLGKHGFSFSKSLGQNFLTDENILNNIVNAADIDENTCVLEVGPGAGTLTAELLKRAKRVVSIEIDKNLVPVLNTTLAEFSNLKLVNDDVLKVDLEKLTREEFGSEPFTVVANLPYYITTPVVMRFLESGLNIKSLTLMVQKEVAERMIAAAGGKEYGALTVAVKYYSEPEIICYVPPHCFMPQPKVTSAVINLNVYDEPPYHLYNKDFFFKIIKSLFSQRRKTLVNSLSKSPYINIDRESIISVLDEMKLKSDIRGEKLDIDVLADFSNRLYTKIQEVKS